MGNRFLFLLGVLIPLMSQAGPLQTPVCANGAVTRGVDVSNYQVGTQWDQTLQSGREFAFIKATEGITYVSPDFERDWAASKEAGVIRGAYHFFRPSDDPIQQADHFLSVMGRIEDTDLPPLFDWEVTNHVPADQIIARARVFLERVEQATGRVPMIYIYPSYWRALGNPEGFERYPLFIANYGVACPEVPAPWKTWTFWQRGIAQAPGIKGSSDQDVFNGGLSLLRQFLLQLSPLF